MITHKNILCPLNLDSDNFTHIPATVEYANFFNGTLHFLYVNDPLAGYRHPTDFQDAVALKVKEIVPAELFDKMKAVYAVGKGDLTDEIKAYCKDKAIDLIITGHRHRTKLYASFFDTPDVSIIDNVRVPILVIPKED